MQLLILKCARVVVAAAVDDVDKCILTVKRNTEKPFNTLAFDVVEVVSLVSAANKWMLSAENT